MCLAGHAEQVWKEYEQTGKRPQERYGDCLYGARSWKRRRRVVMQAGLALQAGRQPKAPALRGDQPGGTGLENRIKELKAGVGPGELHEFLCEPMPCCRSVAGSGGSPGRRRKGCDCAC